MHASLAPSVAHDDEYAPLASCGCCQCKQCGHRYPCVCVAGIEGAVCPDCCPKVAASNSCCNSNSCTTAAHCCACSISSPAFLTCPLLFPSQVAGVLHRESNCCAPLTHSPDLLCAFGLSGVAILYPDSQPIRLALCVCPHRWPLCAAL